MHTTVFSAAAFAEARASTPGPGRDSTSACFIDKSASRPAESAYLLWRSASQPPR
jgi:hypothetical protein